MFVSCSILKSKTLRTGRFFNAAANAERNAERLFGRDGGEQRKALAFTQKYGGE